MPSGEDVSADLMLDHKMYFKIGCSPGGVAALVGASSCTLKGCGFHPWSGRLLEATSRCYSLSPSLPPPLPLSLKSINISSGED